MIYSRPPRGLADLRRKKSREIYRLEIPIRKMVGALDTLVLDPIRKGWMETREPFYLTPIKNKSLE